MKNISFSILLIFFFNFFLYQNSKATHIMGSDLTWTCVGNDSFLVKLTIYRDCNGFDMGNVGINFDCKSSGAKIESKSVQRPAPTDITPTCHHQHCTRCDDPLCSFPYGIQRFIYQTGIINLSNAGACCEILISYSSCCRNNTITTGAAKKPFYTEAWLNRCISPCDNSPTFTNPPVAVICIGQDFVFCHGVLDLDMDSSGGLMDSLTYKFTQPLAGVGNQIQYSAPYSYDKPIYFRGFPDAYLSFPRGLHLDINTGDIKFRPMKIESTVIAIEIKEYRAGMHIGILRRDLQIIVNSCPANHPPVLSGPYYKKVCAGSNVTFNISTNDFDPNDSLFISWNNSIPGATWTDNNYSAKRPTGTLSWTPDSTITKDSLCSFTVTVIDNNCIVNASTTRVYQILVKSLSSSVYSDIKNDQIKLYPNPAKDNITIEFTQGIHSENTKNNSQKVKIEIFDALGNIVRSLIDYEGRSKFNIKLDELQSGYYLTKVQLDKDIYCKKIVLKM